MKIFIVTILLITCQSFQEKNNSNDIIYEQAKVVVNQEFDCEKCNIGFVREIKLNISDLDSSAILNFLCTIDATCKNNVEFSQFSNEMFFMLLLNYPDLTIKLLAKYDFQLDYICNMLSHPIHDGIDITSVAELLQENNTHNQIRKKLLHALPPH